MRCIPIVLLSLLDSSFVFADGSSCVLNTSGEEGTCKSISECPYAQDLMRKNIYPQVCGFGRRRLKICCPSTTSHPSPSSETSLPKPEPSTTPSADVAHLESPSLSQNLATVSDQSAGELSKNKCLSYYPKPLYPIFVTGGRPSLAKEFPHMAIIGYGERNNIQWLCGGSLISKKFVLTAAHCLTSKVGDARYVRLGDLDLSSDEDDVDRQDFAIVRAIPHPSFRPPVRYHDIALLQLDRQVALSAYVSPACLNVDRELNRTELTATGWGHTQFGGNSSSFLLKVDLEHIDHEKCVEMFGKTSTTLLPRGIVDDFQICAGGVIGKDTCQGDSGGPLQVLLEERTFLVKVHGLIGLTSFGKACGLSKAPGIYTRVSNYIPWIESFAWEREATFASTSLN